jgi:hypothetical protein
MSTEGLYIYCVVPGFSDSYLISALKKLGLTTIQYKDINIIASVCNDIAIDFSDRESLGNLVIHHQGTIEDLIASGFRHLIPFKVATVSSSKSEVLEILSAGYDLISDLFIKIQSLAEVDLAVTWSDFSTVLRSLGQNHYQVDKIVHDSSGMSTHDEQQQKWINLRSKLKERSTDTELKILYSLSEVCLDIKQHEVMNYQMITNSAFLINLFEIGKFEQQVARLNREFEGALNFQMIGPLPCYSFFTLETERISPEKIYKANIELGLREEMSESAIREAYQRKSKMFSRDVRLHEGEEEYFNCITNAYHTLIDYSSTVSKVKSEKNKSDNGYGVPNNLMMVRIRN